MTIMTPIEGITAPAIRATEHHPLHPAIPLETFLPQDETPLFSSRRADGWSAANQRRFLECIAEGHGVDAACQHVGLSAASAYAFRRTAKGAAFALGWRAATLVARDAIAEALLVRALEGQVDTVVRADGSTLTRHRHDNRLAMSLLARLDRQVEVAASDTGADADLKAARLVAQDFDAFLDLVAGDEGPARAGLFLARAAMGAAELDPSSSPGRPARPAAASDAKGLAPLVAPNIATMLAPIYALATADRLIRTGVRTAEEVAVTDLDPAARADWTADQWQRAEAAGLLALAVPAPAPIPAETCSAPQHCQHSPLSGALAEADDPVWWDQAAAEWRTSFPPADDDIPTFETHEPAHVDYERSLTDAEAALMGDDPDHYSDAELAERELARDAYFAALAGPPVEPDAAPADPPPAPRVSSTNPNTNPITGAPP